MSTNINKEKAQMALRKIEQTYENSPFIELIKEEINRSNLEKFLEERIKESEEWKMSMIVTDYFKNFNKYPDKLINVIVVEKHSNIEELNANGFFKDPNNNLVLVLNRTFSTNKNTGKIKSHFDYWRIFTAEALDYFQTHHPWVKFIFAGSDIVHDFKEIISDLNEKILLPDTNSLCYKDGSLNALEFASELK